MTIDGCPHRISQVNRELERLPEPLAGRDGHAARHIASVEARPAATTRAASRRHRTCS